MADPLKYVSFHDWCNKGHGMCYPVCGMVHITKILALLRYLQCRYAIWLCSTNGGIGMESYRTSYAPASLGVAFLVFQYKR